MKAEELFERVNLWNILNYKVAPLKAAILRTVMGLPLLTLAEQKQKQGVKPRNIASIIKNVH